VPIEEHEFESGIRYYWKCPVCSEMSLPFKDAEQAAAERSRHLGCASRGRT
jgi:hypothetical protein